MNYSPSYFGFSLILEEEYHKDIIKEINVREN